MVVVAGRVGSKIFAPTLAKARIIASKEIRGDGMGYIVDIAKSLNDGHYLKCGSVWYDPTEGYLYADEKGMSKYSPDTGKLLNTF